MTAPPVFRAALFGYPVGHSRSRELFAALAAEGGPHVDYELVEVPNGALPLALQRLRDGEWDGANITVPHKLRAGELVDARDGDAARSGAVNVICRENDGRLIGFNTDGRGFLRGLTDCGLWSGRPLATVILGAGGAARGVAAALTRDGWAVTLVARSPESAASAAATIGATVVAWTDPQLGDVLREADLLVQATPLGMGADAASPPSPARGAWRAQQIACDLIYHPWETAWLRGARAAGVRAVNGWPMLVHQAAAAADLWFEDHVGDRLVGVARRLESRDPNVGVTAADGIG